LDQSDLKRDKPRAILVIIPFFLPDRGASAAMHSDLWYSLAAQGFDITVRCPIPYYPEWRDKSERNGLRVWRYVDHGVAVERFGLFIPSNPNSLAQRLLFELSMFFSMMRNLSGRKFDAIVSYSPNAACVGYAAFLSALWRKPMWLHILDVTADAASNTGLVKGRFLTRIFKAFEKFLYNRANSWSTISLQMAKGLSGRRSRGQPIFLQPNWLEPQLGVAVEQLRHGLQHEQQGKCRLLYVGNIGAKQNLLAFCKWLGQSDLRFEFRIFGHGNRANEVRSWITTRDDPRFIIGESFLGDVEYAEQLGKTDLCIISEGSARGAAYFPGKAVVAIVAGVPILAVCAVDSPLGVEVDSYDVGLRADWNDLTLAYRLIRDIEFDRGMLRPWRRNCLLRAAYYDREKNLARFVKILAAFSAGTDISGELEPEELATSEV